jgi:glycosyltransferase involved in cell wall biosynthesis
MRIIEINKFNHVRGGADKHFLDLVKLLQSKGEEVAVFSMYHPENRESQWSKYFVSRVDYEKGSFFNKFKGAWRVFWSFEARRKISALLDEFQPDIVHIHNIYHQISPSILPEIKKRQIPVAMTVHDWKLICPNYLLNCEEPYCRKCTSGKYWHCLAKRCVKKSYLKSLLGALEVSFHRWLKIYEKNIDLFLAPSQFVKDILIQAHFPAEKIKVLPHFSHRRGLTSTKGREGYAVYFGRVSKEKNVDELIEIFKDLPTQLVLAGNKDSDFEVPNYPNIKYVGFKRASELEKIIQNSKFVVSASRLPETFGLIALEAIENNKPFLGYKVGAYPEIIKNNENGYLVENRSAFKEKVAQYARGEVSQIKFSGEKFSPERYGEKIIDIFRSLC